MHQSPILLKKEGGPRIKRGKHKEKKSSEGPISNSLGGGISPFSLFWMEKKKHCHNSSPLRGRWGNSTKKKWGGGPSSEKKGIHRTCSLEGKRKKGYDVAIPQAQEKKKARWEGGKKKKGLFHLLPGGGDVLA